METRPALIIQAEKLLFPEVLFNLPVNPTQRPHLTLWGGRAGQLKDTSQLVETIASFGWANRLLAEPSWAKFLPPGTEKLEYEPSPSGQIRDYAFLLEALRADNLVLFGPDLAMTSSQQILAEKLLTELQNTRLVTAEMLRLFATNPNLYRKAELTVFASTADLISLAGRLKIGVKLLPGGGIYNKIELLQRLSAGAKRFVVFDGQQIIAMDSSASGTVGVYNSSTDLSEQRAIFLGLCASLLAVTANNKNFVKSILTACHLVGQLEPAAGKVAPALKHLLSKYFD